MIDKILNLCSNFFLFALIISFIVFIHELGHFIAARRCGIKVEAFSIGFGAPLFKLLDKNSTIWRIGWIPLGGYLKMFGDVIPTNPEESNKIESLSDAEKQSAFFYKKTWQRSYVVFAGPFANYLLAFVLFAGLTFSTGIHIVKPEITSVSKYAITAGLQVGDKIIAVDGKKIDNLNVLYHKVAKSNVGDIISLSIVRDEKVIEFQVKPKLKKSIDKTGAKVKIMDIGIKGDVVVQKINLLQAFYYGGKQVYNFSVMMLDGLWQMIAKGKGLNELGGPIKIVQYTAKSAALGTSHVVFLMAIISLNLGLLNLLPIPLLDGGRLFFYALEAIFRKPLSYKWQSIAMHIGFIILIMLMIFATWNDIKGLVAK